MNTTPASAGRHLTSRHITSDDSPTLTPHILGRIVESITPQGRFYAHARHQSVALPVAAR